MRHFSVIVFHFIYLFVSSENNNILYTEQSFSVKKIKKYWFHLNYINKFSISLKLNTAYVCFFSDLFIFWKHTAAPQLQHFIIHLRSNTTWEGYCLYPDSRCTHHSCSNAPVTIRLKSGPQQNIINTYLSPPEMFWFLLHISEVYRTKSLPSVRQNKLQAVIPLRHSQKQQIRNKAYQYLSNGNVYDVYECSVFLTTWFAEQDLLFFIHRLKGTVTVSFS